jgi:superoxide dismutase
MKNQEEFLALDNDNRILDLREDVVMMKEEIDNVGVGTKIDDIEIALEKIEQVVDEFEGEFEDFKRDFEAEAMKLQGSNWIYLSRDGKIKTIKNHAKRTDIALLVDWWEHAWALDYGTDKKKYLNNIWRIINWEYVNRRIYAGDRA